MEPELLISWMTCILIAQNSKRSRIMSEKCSFPGRNFVVIVFANLWAGKLTTPKNSVGGLTEQLSIRPDVNICCKISTKRDFPAQFHPLNM